MEPDARYTWVGLATLALAALLAGGLYWLMGGTQNHEIKRYTIYFQKQSLEGLQINSHVRMQGIRVGRVTDYAIIPGEAGRVRVQIEVDLRAPVMEGAQAVVNRHLVTGLSAIDLSNDGKSQKPYTATPLGEEFPVIAEGIPTIAAMASTLEELGIRINRLLSDRNQKAVAGLLENMESASGELTRTLPEVRGALGEAKDAARSLRRVADDAGGAVKTIGARLDNVAADAQSTLAQARGSLVGLDQHLSQLTVQLRMTADLGAQEMQTTAQSLRLASDTLQKAARGLGDPTRILYGPARSDLGPGEEQP